MLALVVPVLLGAVEVERVCALVNSVPILTSDVELAEVAVLVPRQDGESEGDYEHAVVTALIELELRWQDLQAAAIVQSTGADVAAAWQAVVRGAGGEEALDRRLHALGLGTTALRSMVRKAAVVEAYVARRFAPFVRPTTEEIETAWREELAPKLRAEGKTVPPLADVRDKVEAIVRERKLTDEVERWTNELARRAEVVRYLR